MTIGERISKLRNSKGYTQEYLATQLGISRQAVHKWEKNETSPDTHNLIALAQVLDTTVEYIAVGDRKRQGKKKMPKLWTYIITIIVTALLTFAATILYVLNRPVSFDAGACGGGFATAVFDQYADKLVADNYFYLTRGLKELGMEACSLSPVRESRDVNYEGKAIYMSFDVEYQLADSRSITVPVRFIGERKWIQQYEWRIVTDDSFYTAVYNSGYIPEKI